MAKTKTDDKTHDKAPDKAEAKPAERHGEEERRHTERRHGDPSVASKGWVRREIHLAANGVSEADREEQNP